LLIRIALSLVSSSSMAFANTSPARLPRSTIFTMLASVAFAGVGVLATASPLTSAVAVLVGMTLGVTGLTAASALRRGAGGSDARGGTDLRMRVESLADVLGHCEVGLVITDPSLRISYANEAFAALCGRILDAAAGTTIVDALAHRIAEDGAFSDIVADLARDADGDASGEVTRLAAPTRTFEWRSVPLRDGSGKTCGRGFVFHDRSQERELAGLKSDFLSTVTHELRTPLTSVKGSLQLVLGKSTGLSAIDSELLHISLKNADRLIRLINDLLDISRLELGKIELTFAKVSTPSLVEEAVSGLRAYAAAREITIGCSVAADVPALAGDRDRLIQVLTNLISNAVKFSPACSHVDVEAVLRDDEVEIAVRDCGIGIPVADQGRLFQRFQRLNPGHSGEPGSGLGLAISKAIIERHGGHILLESREDQGSTFTIVLPAMHEPRIDRDHATRGDVGDAEQPKILLVDDDQELARTLEAAWTGRYRVTSVARGVEALDTALALEPDVVLLDVVLPDLSGYDVLRILRTTVATAAIPVIMLTVQPERALSANLGASDVVAKPLDLPQLTRAVEQALSEHAAVLHPRAAVG
jgi:signal transduction histidine kinase/CheY-like chemotaxis protein